MERINYNNIVHHLEGNDIFFANLHGFRKNHSRESQFILTVEDLAQNLDHGDQMDTIILDFRKAFHKYPINALSVNRSFMVFREVHLYGLNLGSLVELGVSLLMVSVQNL